MPYDPDTSPLWVLNKNRGRFVTALILAALSGVAFRLVQLQYRDLEHFRSLAGQQHHITKTVPARPGNIFDRSGRLLASSILVNSVYANPGNVNNPSQIAEQLADVLSLDPDRLRKQFLQHSDRQFIWIKRRLSNHETKAIQDLELDPNQVGFRTEFQRFYPQERAASHLIGFRDIDGEGQGGIEHWYNSTLKGQDGQRYFLRDALGQTISDPKSIDQRSVPGKDVILTIDAFIQTFVERALDELVFKWKPTGASCVVLNSNTGEVLAMSTRPSFDPNNMDAIAQNAWRNRAISDVYEPGSTFKPFVMARALDIHAVLPTDTIHCEQGLYRMGSRLLHDHRPFGNLSLIDVIVRSSNIGMAKIGEKLGNQRMYQAVSDFGFGRPTGITLPGESPGMLLPMKQWTSYSTGSIPMGHEIGVTPIQLIMAYCAIANGGQLLKPKLTLATSQPRRWLGSSSLYTGVTATNFVRRSSTLKKNPTQTGMLDRSPGRPLAKETADWLIDPVLKNVVHGKRGTGRRARLEEYDIFGKSGTAQKLNAAGTGYSHQKHISSFIAGGPVPRPSILVLIVVDEPQANGQPYGGKVAAPTAALILRRTLIHLKVPARSPTL